MKTILLKLIKDFRLTKGKLLLILMAACLSGWGISSVVYGYIMAERDFKVNFERTFPADIELLIENYSEELEEEILADDNVVDIERREVVSGRVKDIDGNWMPFRLFAVEDIDNMRYNRFRILEEDSMVSDKILIETNAKFFLDPDKNQIELQFPEKGEIIWEIGGTSHDARLAPARMEHTVFAHTTSIGLIKDLLPAGRRRILIKTNVNSSKEQLEKISERLVVLVKRAGGNLIYASVPEPGHHIHQNIVDGVSFLQGSMGVILSIMGIVLLSLVLLTWVFPQISQVGVMKALGASTKQIFYSYTLVLVLIIAIGLAIGMPIGYITASGYNGLIAFVQNFEPVREILPLHIHVIVIIIGLLMPLIFAVLPLSRAAKTSVNDALNKTFFIKSNGFFKISRTLVSNSLIKYSLNNLFRNGQRTFLLILLISTGLGIFFTGGNLEHSIRSELNRFATSATYGLRVQLNKEVKKKDISFLYDLPSVRSISKMKDKLIGYRPPNSSYSEMSQIRTISSDHRIENEFVLKGKIDKKCKECIYLSGEQIRQEFEDVKLGDSIQIEYKSGEIKSYIYSGIFKDMAATSSPFFLIDDNDLESFNALAFEIKPGFSYHEAGNAIDNALLGKGIDVRSMLDINVRLAQLQGHLEPTYLIIKAMGVFTILLGFLGLLSVLNLTIQERTREIGIMKSIGCSLKQISGLFQIEFILVNVLSIGLGVLIAIPVSSSLCKVFSETVIYLSIPSRTNFLVIGFTIILLLIAQIILIAVYNRFKISKNARELMDHNF